MNDDKVRAILSIIIVLTFMIVTGIIAVYVYANDLAGVADASKTSEHLKDYSALFTGIIGIIIGYYFGKSPSKKP